MRTTRLALLLSLAALPACESSSTDDDGASDGPPGGAAALDCAWIQSDNCWRQAARAVAGCVPQPDGGVVASGAFDAERTTCSYDMGPTVRFDAPAIPWDPYPSTTVVEDAAGAECARLGLDEGHTRLTTASGAVDVQATPGDCPQCYDATITCPDGSSVFADDLIATMKACAPDPSDWPGTIVNQEGPNLVGIDLAGGDGGQIELFACTY